MPKRRGHLLYLLPFLFFSTLGLCAFGFQNEAGTSIRELLKQGRNNVVRKNIQKAKEQFKRAVKKARTNGSPALQAESHIALGDLYFNHTNNTGFVEQYRKAIKLKKQINNWGLRIRILIREGILDDTKKQYNRAQRHYWRAIVMADRTWKPSVAGKAVNSFIGSLTASGATRPKVLGTLTQFEKICRNTGYPTALARLLLVRSAFMKQRMNREDVADLLRNRAYNLISSIAGDFLQLSQTRNKTGEDLFLVRNATNYARVAQDRNLEGLTYLNRSEILQNSGDRKLSSRESRWAWQLLKENPDVNVQLRLHQLKGTVHLQENEPNSALDTFMTGFHIARSRNRISWMNRFRNKIKTLENRFENPAFIRKKLSKLQLQIRRSILEMTEGKLPIPNRQRQLILNMSQELNLDKTTVSSLRIQQKLAEFARTGRIQNSASSDSSGKENNQYRNVLKKFLSTLPPSRDEIAPDAFLDLWKNSDTSEKWILATRSPFQPANYFSPAQWAEVVTAVPPGSSLQLFLLGILVGDDLPAQQLDEYIKTLLETEDSQLTTKTAIAAGLFRWNSLKKTLLSAAENLEPENDSTPYLEKIVKNRSSRVRFMRTVCNWKDRSDREKFHASIASLATGVTVPSELLLENKDRRKKFLDSCLAFLSGLQTVTDYPGKTYFMTSWLKTDRQKYFAAKAGLYSPTSRDIKTLSMANKNTNLPFRVLFLETVIQNENLPEAVRFQAVKKVFYFLSQSRRKESKRLHLLGKLITATLGTPAKNFLSELKEKTDRENSISPFANAMKTTFRRTRLKHYHPYRKRQFIRVENEEKTGVYALTPEVTGTPDGNVKITVRCEPLFSGGNQKENLAHEFVSSGDLSLSTLSDAPDSDSLDVTRMEEVPGIKLPGSIHGTFLLFVKSRKGLFPGNLLFYVEIQ